MRQMIMKLSTTGVAVLSCVALAGAALAWQAVTSPNQAVLTEIANAKPGATIVIPDSFNGPLVITGKHFTSPITIRNNSTSVQSILIRDSSNIIVEGGAVIGGTGVSYAVHIDRAKSIAVRGMTITGAVRGMVINRSESIGVFNNRFTGLRTDGVNAAESRKIVIEGNSCANFNPILPIYDAAGTLIKDGDHPDCIQLWSRPTTAPTADIVIRGNTMTGGMQGIFLGNHIRNGVDDGGFDRVVIENNFVHISFPNGILVGSGRTVRLVGNEIQTIDGARLKNGTGILVKAALKAVNSTDVFACSNIVEAVPTGFGTATCAGQPAPVPTITTAPVAPVPVAPVPGPEVPPTTALAPVAPAPVPVVTTTVALAPIAPAPVPVVTTTVALAPIAPAPTSAPTPVVAAPTVTAQVTEPVLAVVQAVIAEPTITTAVAKTPRGRKGGRGNFDLGDGLVLTGFAPTSPTTTARAAVAPATPAVTRTVLATPATAAPIVTAPASNPVASQPVLAVVQAMIAPTGATSRAPDTSRSRTSRRGSDGAE